MRLFNMDGQACGWFKKKRETTERFAMKRRDDTTGKGDEMTPRKDGL